MYDKSLNKKEFMVSQILYCIALPMGKILDNFLNIL